MKRFLRLSISLVLMMSLLLSGCSSEEEVNRETELQTSLERTYDDLTSAFSGETGQYELISEYLKSWANNNDVELEESHEHYMVLVNPPTEGFEDSETTVLQCAIETDDFTNSLHTLSVSLTALLGPEVHGKITLIVTENNDGEYIGAASADPKYYECDHFINMQPNDEINLITSGAYEAAGSMKARLTMEEPAYSHAYAITMSTAGHHDPFDFNGRHYPNPIEVIGSLLASEKSAGQLFQLASFECESDAGYIPRSATAIVVIDENDVESFTKRFNSSYNSMKNRFEKLEDNFVYTFTETAMPAKVLSNQAGDNIISLMYTLNTGIYLQDEDSGEVLAASDISKVSTLNKKFSLMITFRSVDRMVLKEMSDVFLTTSGLCDIKYTPSKSRLTWTSDETKQLASFFADALGSEEYITEATIQSSECDILSEKEPLNAISYRFDINHEEAALTNLLHFLESLAPSEDAAAAGETSAE